MDIQAIIVEEFSALLTENKVNLPSFTPDLVLLESGLDSMGFAILVTRLEDRLEYDPFLLAEEAVYPSSLGDFVDFYKKYQPC